MSSGAGASPAPDWLAAIPGYAGYRAKEDRRQADRALRTELNRRALQAVGALQRLSGALAGARRYDELGALDALTSRLQYFADRLLAVPEGYRGLFDRERVDEAALDQMMAFDESLAGGVDRLGTLAGALDARAPAPLESPAGQELIALVEKLHARLDARTVVVSQAAAMPPEQVLSVLEPPARPAPPPRYIKLGDAVGYGDADYIVDALINYAGPRQWSEYRLAGGDAERWLLVEPGGTYLLGAVAPERVTIADDGASAEVEGRRYTRLATGQATAELGGPSGQRRGVPVEAADYRDEAGARLAVRDWGTERRLLQGEEIDAALLHVYPRA